MSTKLDLELTVKKIFREQWVEIDGRAVPDDNSVTFGNDGINLKGTVLYADLAESTKLVDAQIKTFAAEIYKTFLHCAAKIIREHNGVITAYDGDRIMAVFIGDYKNTSAVKAALKLNYIVRDVIMPAKNAQYPDNPYVLKHVVGIDTSELFVAKTGVRGANDLVWVGKAANHAAKLAALPDTFATYISSATHNVLNEEAKISSTKKNMWEQVRWTFNNSTIYRSNWTMTVK